ncbi:LapA family protein [Corynebacterium halotolerans]|uniref:Lipopolysaccharide assembly protein A domain-containing protein n=1 Tax=Corynebacterium halotolerans YIM 70093 = DSM 44683 TaxID=1121362 RepID=M1NN18_9CORY|nr:lipopolysaccharide assembly protein LapA domain-containing protein [Corynebacterium halotolerans]AGF72768.1 hypothetical protein A605_08830 [Corynebacterium halotolerans YIM 70093 = DSM 44683]
MTHSPRHPDERDTPSIDPSAETARSGVPAGFDDAPRDDTRAVAVPDAPEDTATDAVPAKPTEKTRAGKSAGRVDGSLAGSTWAALIVGALLLILLLVFILQNQQQVELNLFAWSFQFPAGIGYLFSAIAGALIMALAGGVRMIELRRQVKKLRRQQR